MNKNSSMDFEENDSKKHRPLSKRSLARFIACQALCVYYDRNNEDRDINSLVDSIEYYFVRENFLQENGNNRYLDVGKNEFMLELIGGVIAQTTQLDDIINGLLNRQDTVEGLDDVILQCFRLAGFELLNHPQTDGGTIINEYVDIVAEFYEGAYIGFANALLDSMAKLLRGDDGGGSRNGNRNNYRNRDEEDGDGDKNRDEDGNGNGIINTSENKKAKVKYSTVHGIQNAADENKNSVIKSRKILQLKKENAC